MIPSRSVHAPAKYESPTTVCAPPSVTPRAALRRDGLPLTLDPEKQSRNEICAPSSRLDQRSLAAIPFAPQGGPD